MPSERTQVDQDIFTVSGLFSRDECVQVISQVESLGFAAASVRTSQGPQMMTHIRNNDRVNFQDEALAEQMWQRVRTFLPELDEEVPCGIDPRLRVYRYVPGQQFKRHKDGTATSESGQTSKLSYLVYLNDDYEGGSTEFRDYRDVDGVREKVISSVTPATGMALLFRHKRWHEGTPVTTGTKYVLRSDVFYTPKK